MRATAPRCAIARWSRPATGFAWIIGAFVICPCHLPITLGILAVLLAGTAAGAFVTVHPYVAGTILSLLWLAATLYGFRRLRAAEDGVADARNTPPEREP